MAVNVALRMLSTILTLSVEQPNELNMNNKNSFSSALFPAGESGIFNYLDLRVVVPNLNVTLINIKRLIDEINNGEIANANIIRETPLATIAPPIYSNDRHLNISVPNPMDFFKRKPQEVKLSVKELFSPTSINEKENRGSKPDNVVVGSIFAAIFSWGLNNDLDSFFREELKLAQPRNRLIGCRGAGGYLAFPIVSATANTGDDWKISSTISSQRILSIVALAKSLIANYGLVYDPSTLFRKFAEMVPDGNSDYYSPSLSILIKFWQDSISKKYCFS